MLLRIQRLFHADPGKRRFCLQPLQEIVGGRTLPEFGLDLSAVRSNDLMGGLSIRTVANRGHQQCFGSQERHLSHQVGAAYRWVGDQSLGHISKNAQGGVGRQKSFGQGQPSIGRIVKGAFEPLGGGRLVRIGHQVHHESCQTTGPLASHGVAFVGHGRRADLFGLEGLVHLGEGVGVVAVEDDAVVHAVPRGVDDHQLGLDGEQADEADAELADLGQVLFLAAAEQGQQVALDGGAVHAFAVVGDRDAEAALLTRQKAALSYLESQSADGTEDDAMRRRGQITKAQAALTAWPGFWPAALHLADLHAQAGSPKKAVKPLETAFRHMPHDAVAARLRTLWGVNEGASVARLMRLIPKDGQLADEGRLVVAQMALDSGLVGEARRLLDEIDPAHRDAAGWRLVARLAAEDETSAEAAETDALRQAGEAPRPRRWQCTSCQLVHESWQPHCGGCAGFATLDWQRPDGVSPLVTAADETD